MNESSDNRHTAYEKPRVLRLGGQPVGAGACTTGSGAAPNCYVDGNNAVNECGANGIGALGDCSLDGSSAGALCSTGIGVTG